MGAAPARGVPEHAAPPDAPPPVRQAGAVGAADVRRVWQEIQEAVKQRKKRTAALLVSATVRAVENDTLVLSIGTAPLARLLSEQSNTDVIAEALHAVLGVRWRVRCEHGDGTAPRAQEPRQAPRPAGGGPSARAPQVPSDPPPGGAAPGSRPPVASGGGRSSAASPPQAESPSRAGGPRWQSGAASTSGARPAGRPSGRDDGEPLPPEPPEDDTPPDDEEAMLAELAAGPSEQAPAARSDPEEAAIALLTSQLGARAIDRR
jgi:DNA polymerase-3 subunit gamma/tau